MQENIKKGANALDLFPDIFGTGNDSVTQESNTDTEARPMPGTTVILPEPKKTVIEPPPAPDVSWLPGGSYEGEGEDTSLGRSALTLFSGAGKRALVSARLHDLGFEVTETLKGEEAIFELGHSAYSLIVCDIEDAVPDFQEFMAWLPMVKRRVIYYTLIGSSLHTLYALEAVSHSANLVVNDRHIHHLDRILAKGFADYEQLYGPYLEELQIRSPGLTE